MNITNANNLVRLPVSFCWLASFALIVSPLYGSNDLARAATVVPLFDAPPPPTVSDEVLLLSTRAVGTVCSGENMHNGLRCQRLATSPTGQQVWQTSDWRRLLSTSCNLPTIVYVHGNRIDRGLDRTQGMQIYRSLKAHTRLHGPIRFIIWSWPSSQIPGPIKDYLVKARRTNPAAWQLAWLLDKLPVDTQISLVGYSYGTRVVSGATHLLAGGRLDQLKLVERKHPERPPVRAALLAAAYDADWLQPGHFYGHSFGQLERLVLATNKLDPAMRFYHLSNGRGRMHALGKSGVHQPWTLGTATHRLWRVDFTHAVGRSHSLADYLAAKDRMSLFWHQLTVPHYPAMAFVEIEQQTESIVQN